MLDYLVGLLLFGLGLKPPQMPPEVKGDTTEVQEVVEEQQGGLGVTPGPARKARENQQEAAKEARERAREQAKEAAEKRREEAKLRAEEIREAAKQREENLKEIFKNRQEKLKAELEAKRAEAREKFKEERAEFKEKLAKLRDERKKAVVTNIDARIAEINKKRTEVMLSHLTKMNEVLDKISARASAAREKGKDVTSVESAISAGRTAIASAQSAVTTQAGKAYVISIESEENLGENVSAAMRQMETDLKNVQALVVAARKAVTGALEALGKLVASGAELTSPTPAP